MKTLDQYSVAFTLHIYNVNTTEYWFNLIDCDAHTT